MHVFIADRDPLVRIMIRMVLLKGISDQNISEASDGLSALNKIRLEPPEILLIDLEIPGFSGLELVRSVRIKNKDIKIIAMLDFYNDTDMQAVFEAGVNGFILRNRHCEKLLQKISYLDNMGSDQWVCLNDLQLPTTNIC